MDQKNKSSKKCSIMGHKIELDKIENPHIRKAIHSRAGFLFFKKNDDSRPGHTDQKRHNDHWCKIRSLLLL